MTKIATLKAQATNMRLSLEKSGVSITHAQALEAVAAQYGFETWDALAGTLNQKSETQPPRLSDMSAYPAGVWVERGHRSDHYSVDHCDMGAIGCLHDEAALKEYLEGSDHLATSLIVATAADGEEVRFSAEELLGAEFEELGGLANWKLADGTYLRFDTGGLWQPKPRAVKGPPELQVPELVRSLKGVQLLVLSSIDSPKHDRYVAVPAHLNVSEIGRKFDEELKRLKSLDEELPEEDFEQREYTIETLRAFAASLGCWMVRDVRSTFETWDTD